MASKPTLDERTLSLIERLEQEEKELVKTPPHSYKTRMIFAYNESDPDNRRNNLHTISDVIDLVKILAFLLSQKKEWEETCNLIGIEGLEFTWQDHSFRDWEWDIKAKAASIKNKDRKEVISKSLIRLRGVMSDTLKQDLTLKELEKVFGI